MESSIEISESSITILVYLCQIFAIKYTVGPDWFTESRTKRYVHVTDLTIIIGSDRRSDCKVEKN